MNDQPKKKPDAVTEEVDRAMGPEDTQPQPAQDADTALAFCGDRIAEDGGVKKGSGDREGLQPDDGFFRLDADDMDGERGLE